jgi:hypothetical protein
MERHAEPQQIQGFKKLLRGKSSNSQSYLASVAKETEKSVSSGRLAVSADTRERIEQMARAQSAASKKLEDPVANSLSLNEYRVIVTSANGGEDPRGEVFH